MNRALSIVVLSAWLLAACDDALLAAFEQAPIQGGAGAPGLDADAGGSGGQKGSDSLAGAGLAGANTIEPNPPSPFIDDFEDGDTRAKEPRGWWYPVNDGTGTQGFGIEPASPANGSVYALRTHGSGFQDWGAAVGVDLVGDSTPFDASTYDKLCFGAHIEADTSSAIQVHLIRDGQHYIKDVSLSETWTSYCLPLVDFIGSDATAFVPNELIALQFFFPPKAPFALWLDDVEFAP